MFQGHFEEGLKQWSLAKSFHHGHDHHFIIGSSTSKVKLLNIVVQTFTFLLVNGEEVGGILLPDSGVYEMGNKELTYVAK